MVSSSILGRLPTGLRLLQLLCGFILSLTRSSADRDGQHLNFIGGWKAKENEKEVAALDARVKSDVDTGDNFIGDWKAKENEKEAAALDATVKSDIDTGDKELPKFLPRRCMMHVSAILNISENCMSASQRITRGGCSRSQ
ncbi:uncharacterized protein [Lolium perenne]|uniref:uncharacterized protein isoform X3 n=1 Tax=Lolium perenne TaxID=4522 RepID=UPI003A9999A6